MLCILEKLYSSYALSRKINFLQYGRAIWVQIMQRSYIARNVDERSSLNALLIKGVDNKSVRYNNALTYGQFTNKFFIHTALCIMSYVFTACCNMHKSR